MANNNPSYSRDQARISFDHNLQVSEVNALCAKLLGFNKPDNMLGKRVFDIKTACAELAPEYYKQDKKVLTTGKPAMFYSLYDFDVHDLVDTITYKRPVVNNGCIIGVDVFFQSDPFFRKKFIKLRNEIFNPSFLPKVQGFSYEIINSYTYENISIDERLSRSLYLLAHGVETKRVAEICDISTRAVERHRSKIMSFFNIDKHSNITSFMLGSGLIYKIPYTLLPN